MSPVQDQSSAGEGSRDSDGLRYPIGRFVEDPQPTPEKHERWINDIAALPGEVRTLVAGLADRQLDTPYRPGGWTVRQVVHHLADSHLNAYLRTKLALTEEVPTIKPYDQVAWATLPDTRAAPPEASMDLLQGLHTRWVAVLRTLDETSLQRKLHHPEDGMLTVSRIIQSYAWHGRHHHAHIANLRSRMGGARIGTDYSGRPIRPVLDHLGVRYRPGRIIDQRAGTSLQ